MPHAAKSFVMPPFALPPLHEHDDVVRDGKRAQVEGARPQGGA
jgi:hypothetical protein